MTDPTASDAACGAWPVLARYDVDHLARISLPLGGIGTGSIGLGGRGELRDFQLGDAPSFGLRPHTCFAAVRVAGAGVDEARVLEGPIPFDEYEAAYGSTAANHGLPRFATAAFETSYPFGRVVLGDDALPVAVAAEAFTPLVPADVDASSWPAASLRYSVRNTGAAPLEVSVCVSMSNFVGPEEDRANTLETGTGMAGVVLRNPALAAESIERGELAIAAVAEPGELTVRKDWARASWGTSLLDFWDDFAGDGRVDPRVTEPTTPTGTVCVSRTIEPGEASDFEFVLAWAFPNRRAWRSDDFGGIDVGEYSDDLVGNHYTVEHPDSWRTAVEFRAALPELERRTVRAVTAIVETDAPAAIKEGALFNVSTLRSPTVFRTADGRFYGWEGVGDTVGSCYGTCSHVWGYEFTTSYWFADIARSLRDTQFAQATDERGLMSFRVGLPLETKARSWRLAAADGQMASIVHLHHDWRLSGDDDMLRRLWPAARRALEFAWIPGGWDADRDGVMEGVQHNTMDVEYYGPNPQMTGWYVAALAASAVMARRMGDDEFAARCEGLARDGAAWVDANLFADGFYGQRIRPVPHGGLIAEGLRHEKMGAADTEHPDLQIGDGCLIDQLVGDHAAVLGGLGHVFDERNVATTMQTILERNTVDDPASVMNCMRSFVLGDERALAMCGYADGERPLNPFPYFSETMTGFEYTAALGLVQSGDRRGAERVVCDIRRRYDGRRRSPFDEAECGRHYARAMAAWSVLVAWTGFDYDAHSGLLRIDRPAEGASAYWSTGSAWGEVRTERAEPGAGARTSLHVHEGELALTAVVLPGASTPHGEGRARAGDVISLAD